MTRTTNLPVFVTTKYMCVHTFYFYGEKNLHRRTLMWPKVCDPDILAWKHFLPPNISHPVTLLARNLFQPQDIFFDKFLLDLWKYCIFGLYLEQYVLFATCNVFMTYILLTSSNNQISEFRIPNILFTCLIKQ